MIQCRLVWTSMCQTIAVSLSKVLIDIFIAEILKNMYEKNVDGYGMDTPLSGNRHCTTPISSQKRSGKANVKGKHKTNRQRLLPRA